MRHWDFVSSCDLHLHLASTNNAAAYYLPLGHQTVRAPLEKNCHSQIMRRQQELFGEGSRSGLQNWCSCFCQDVRMVDAGMAGNHVCYKHVLNRAWKRTEIKAWLELVRDIKLGSSNRGGQRVLCRFQRKCDSNLMLTKWHSERKD